MADTPFSRTRSGRYDTAGLSSKEFSRVFDQIDKDRRKSRRIARRTLNPLTLKNKALDDIIALGKKKSGTFFTKEDLKGFEANRAGARQQFNSSQAGITYAQLVAGSQQIDIKRANNRVDDGSGIKRATPTTLKHNVLTVSVEASAVTGLKQLRATTARFRRCCTCRTCATLEKWTTKPALNSRLLPSSTTTSET